MPNTLDARFDKDTLAGTIADKWLVWNGGRDKWSQEKAELRKYLFATSTRDTTNAQLPWKNSTVTPKLTQIRDNLHANYMAALFPREAWFQWQAADTASAAITKRNAIEAYMRTKLRASDFEKVVEKLVLDYIDYGNVFAGHEYVCEKKTDPVTKEEATLYSGPRAFRVSPLDILFDPTASSFDKSPAMVRRLLSLGDLEKTLIEKPTLGYKKDVLDKLRAVRVSGPDTHDALKNEGLNIDGFGSLSLYFASGMVELLDFYGDIYDSTTGIMHTDMIITVVDRRWILRMVPNESWTGSRPIKHCGWRVRPDNLWAQGPLDQLVGLQYRIDHLENLKADVFDQIAHPIVEIVGTTSEDFQFKPGEQFHSGDEGGIKFHRPEANALSADMEIERLMQRMEELAGAPRDAMGIRTPGEKTKYEVQVLENGAGRIFQAKVRWFESNILEPLLNSMFEEAVRKMGAKESVRVVDADYGTVGFKDITKEDVTAKGSFYAVGARHFAEQARAVQELTQTMQIVRELPTVAPHISGKAVARMLGEKLGWSTFGIVKDNVAITEQKETQALMNTAAEQLQTEAGMPAELQDADMVPPDGGGGVPRNMLQ